MASKATCVHRTLFSDQRTIVFTYEFRAVYVLVRKIGMVFGLSGSTVSRELTGANSISLLFTSSSVILQCSPNATSK